MFMYSYKCKILFFRSPQKLEIADFKRENHVVDTVLARRIINGKKEYLVHWRGFSHDENTWEPVNLLECQQLIIEYESSRRRP